eukprot:11209979-Lingulodinium_polyedra.AAC.1
MRQRCARNGCTNGAHAHAMDGGPDDASQLTTNAAPVGHAQRHGGWACNARAHSVLENWAQH